MKDYQYILLGDLKNWELSKSIIIIGIVTDKWHYKNVGMTVSDITGEANIRVCTADDRENPLFKICTKIKRGQRVIIHGTVSFSERKSKKIVQADRVEIVDQSIFDPNQKYGFDVADQVSSYRLCRIINRLSMELKNSNYIEICCRMSTRIQEQSAFCPLELNYRGYGSPGYLVVSPAPQLIEFLTVTSIPRAFTSTTSFSPSYRFQNGSTEMPIIMAKATNMSLDELVGLMKKCCNAYFGQLFGRKLQYNTFEETWGNEPDFSDTAEGCFNIISFITELPSAARRWESIVNRIVYLMDDKGNLLAEGYRETTKGNAIISTLTLYPTQFLSYTSQAPRRQLLNLANIYDGENKNG